MKNRIVLFVLFFFICHAGLFAQSDSLLQPVTIDYAYPTKYEIEKITVRGAEHFDKNVLIVLSGLSTGSKIKVPGEDISKAILNLWKQKLFDDIKISITAIHDDKIHLEIYLQEKPRMSRFSIRGLSKGKARDLREELTLKAGMIITENLISNTENKVKKYYAEKGFLRCEVNVTYEIEDVAKNMAFMRIFVSRGPKVKINKIIINGNEKLSDRKIWRQFKETKPRSRFLAKSRYIEEEFQDDKQKIIDKYLSLGYRDIAILSDSIFYHDKRSVDLVININEGKKYYFRDIDWTGNTKYTDTELSNILKIKSGDVYDQSILDTRLNMNQNGLDVSTLYMDDGYLFFNVTPVEVLVENDSIDLEIRLYEGQQAIINKVTVKGNTKTSDHVVLRELRTRPGQKFSRSDITRTMRELSQLGYFDPEQLGVNPIPNQATGTVDIEYKVEERPSDQIELSGGFGNGFVVGTLGLNLSNFSSRKMFKAKEWNPIPSGDGQRLSLRIQSNGTFFQSYSLSFTEPWLGGRKPNAFSISLYRSIQKAYQAVPARGLFTNGIVLGLGKRLKWPDDYFTLQYALSYQHYYHQGQVGNEYIAGIPLGNSHNLNLRFVFGRNSVDQPIYPRSGSNISFTAQLTPPYSMLRSKSFEELSSQQRTKFVEYHKWKFDAQWFTKLAGDLVFMTRANFGFMGYYTKEYGITGFERFWAGGSGLTGFNVDGRELVSLRGYSDFSLAPYTVVAGRLTQVGAPIHNRYTMELRYPISLNPSATVYLHTFAEAGKSTLMFREFNPFEVYRSAGMGVRLFLPMFGLIGLDYGYGFDLVDDYTKYGFQQPGKGNFHFFLGQQF